MVKNFDRKFIDEKYNFLVEQEKGLMVATQGHVDRLIVREEKDTILTHNSVIKKNMLSNYCTFLVKKNPIQNKRKQNKTTEIIYSIHSCFSTEKINK